MGEFIGNVLALIIVVGVGGALLWRWRKIRALDNELWAELERLQTTGEAIVVKSVADCIPGHPLFDTVYSSVGAIVRFTPPGRRPVSSLALTLGFGSIYGKKALAHALIPAEELLERTGLEYSANPFLELRHSPILVVIAAVSRSQRRVILSERPASPEEETLLGPPEFFEPHPPAVALPYTEQGELDGWALILDRLLGAYVGAVVGAHQAREDGRIEEYRRKQRDPTNPTP